jgi:hypothetical protein
MSNGTVTPNQPRRRLRRLLTAIIVALAILVFTATVPAAWARRTALNTDRFVELVGPLADDPAIQQALADKVTERVMSLLDIDAVVNDLFPERGAVLVGPLSNAIEGYVHGLVLRVFESDAFTTLWTEAIRFVHTEMLAVLDGGTDTVSTVGGKVALNLMPMVQLVLEQMAALVPDLIGRNITIPEIDVSMAPSEAVSRLESAFGIDLPDGFGTVVVYDANELEALQKAVRTFDKLVIVLVLLVLVLVALALWSSPRRRRTLLQLMTGFAVGLVVVRRLAIAASDQALESARPENQAAAHAFTDRVLGNLLVYTGWLLAVVLVVLVIAWLTGSYPAPVAIRRWVADLARSIGGAVTAERPRSPAVAWIGAHREPLMFAAAAIALLVLLIADVSLLGLLLTLAVAGIIELVIYRVGTSSGDGARVVQA